MAVTYGFYNALEHDRLYDAIQMSSIFDGIIRDGVFSTIGTSLTVTAPEDGLYVNVGPGRAWFNHTWTLNDTEYPVEAEEAEVVLDRIDAVILETNSAAEVRANRIYFLKGTPSSEPVKPTLTHNAEVNQYALAYVRIRAGQTTIFQADIENAVGTDETPFVTGLMQQVSIENLILQWEAEFDDHFENWRNINEAEFEVWSQEMQDEYNAWILNQVNTYQTWFAGIQAEAGDDIDEVMAWFEHMKGQVSEDAAIRLQEEIDDLALAAEKGSVVTVHTINQTLYGKNCVISQDGQSRTARFDNTGTAVFESVPYVGQVTITATDGTLTAVTYLTIPYFGRYTTNLAFWAATVELSTQSPEFFSLPIKIFKDNVLIETISFSALGAATYIATSEGTYKFSVTYDNADFDHTIVIDEETTYTVVINDWNATLAMQTSVSELYGRGITISKGGVTVGTTTFNGSGHATYKVHEPGTYHIVTSTAGGDTYSADVVVTEETAYPVDLGLPNGSTVLPTDDIQTWLHCAGINDKGYTTLSEVLEDSVTFNALLGDSNACDYMARSATFAGKGAGLVPTMTNYTTPSGEVTYSTEHSSTYAAWKAFGNIADYGWVPNTSDTFGNAYIQYDFGEPVIVGSMMQEHTSTSAQDSYTAYTTKLQGSNDGVTFTDIKTDISTPNTNTEYYIDVENTSAYRYYRVVVVSATPSTMTAGRGLRLQFFTFPEGITDSALAMSLLGRYDYACEALLANSDWAEAICNSEYFESVLDTKVPNMTSNTAPEGTCFATSVRDSYAAYMAFTGNTGDPTGLCAVYNVATWGVGYEFPEPVKIYRVQAGYSTSNLGGFSNWRIQYSDDGINWEYASDDPLVITSAVTTIAFMPVFVEDAHKYWRLYAPSTSGWTAIRLVNFIGRHSSQNLVPLVPTMTSNTTPSGEVIYSSQYSNEEAYSVFTDAKAQWSTASSGESGAYVGYIFPTAQKICRVYGKAGNQGTQSYTVQYSDDGSNWTSVDSAHAFTTSGNYFDVSESDPHRYWRIYHAVGSGYNSMATLQFYGEAPTSVIHSVPNDTVYYLDNGVETTLCTCDSNGVGEVDWSDLPQGLITLYSTTAKDPNNLSNDFSMSIRNTPNKVDAFLIPDGALYWWGWEGKDFEFGTVRSAANANVPIASHTKNTNNIQLQVADSSSGVSVAGQNVSKVLDLSDVDSIKTILSFNSGHPNYSTRMCVTPTALTGVQFGYYEHYLSDFTIPTYSVATSTNDFAGVYDTPKLETIDVSNLSTGQIVQGVSGGRDATRGISTLYAVLKIYNGR